MVNQKNVETKAEIFSKIEKSNALFFTEYRGLTVAELKDLRNKLGLENEYNVTKNTLAKIAAKEAGLPDLDSYLSGATAIGFIGDDPINAAKVFADFSKGNEKLIVKGALYDGVVYDAEGVKKLASLESREVLLAKFAGDVKATMAMAAATFQALPTKTVRTIDALKAQK
ncbi:MAG: 50S ribosomal protein L10 [Bifidobacteriaceae bacterium]|jgi:large subunit ribosomal protein L10|nr:50S ribosomal protein L10 [Bifidobacteriaceae bacterium]